VTRRKLAKGFSAVHKSSKQTSGKAEAGGLVLTPAENVAIKGEVAEHNERELHINWKAGDELVFVY
jgi:hypothetical protein